MYFFSSQVHLPDYKCDVSINIQVTNLVKEMEFVFVPFVNPDGYEVRILCLLSS